MSRPADPGTNRPRQPKGRTGRRRFPVVVVRPATVPPTGQTASQRQRQRLANHLAHIITESTRNAMRDGRDTDFDLALSMYAFPEVTDAVREIIRDAPDLAARPPAGALRVGRDNRGRVTVVVLHAPTWSLLVRPEQPHPAAFAFLDVFNSGLALRLDGDADLLQVRWDDMLDAVLTAATS